MCGKILGRSVSQSVLMLSVFFIMVLAISPIAEATPELPYFMYGEITINGIAAPAGTVVEALFEDNIRESTTTTEKGFYGTPAWNRLLINGVSGETYTFRAKSPTMDSYATTAQTSTFKSGILDDIDLHFTWDGVIEPDNAAPVADNLYINIDEDNSVPITLIASDTDGDDLTYTVLTNPSDGTLTGTAPSLTYTPNHDYNGADVFTYNADDGTDDSNTATVYIYIDSVNDIPIASDVSAVTSEDTAKVIALDASDADDNPLTYSIVSVPSHGTVTLSSPIATYTPDDNYYGGDTFTYKVSDGTADSNTATVTIDVTFVNQAPVVSNPPSISLGAESIITTAWTLDSCVDDETADSSIIWISATPEHLSVTINPDRTLTIESSSDFSENTTLSLTASDGDLSGNSMVSITFIPVIVDVTLPEIHTSPPILPAFYYGAVRIDYIPAPIGTSIVAKIDGETRGTFMTTVSGLYGDHPANRLMVEGSSEDTGKTVSFYIDGDLAEQNVTWHSGDVLELDLTTNPNPNNPPILPAFYYGAVRIDYIPAPIGTSIVAKIGDETRGTFVTTVSGLYGDSQANRLMVEGVSADAGKTVSFYIGGHLAEQTVAWHSGDVLELDLTTNPNPNNPPTFPHFLYGIITIDGTSAPTGTIVEALIDGVVSGSMTTTELGVYGTPARSRLIVTGVDGDNITFRAKGPDMDTYASSNETMVFVAGVVENFTLHFVSEPIVPPPIIIPPSSSRSGGGGSSSYIVAVDTSPNESNQSNSSVNISIENSSLNMSEDIDTSEDDGGTDQSDREGISSGDDSGTGGDSLFDTASSVDPGSNQDTGFITGFFLGESAPSPYVSGMVVLILGLTLGYVIFLK